MSLTGAPAKSASSLRGAEHIHDGLELAEELEDLPVKVRLDVVVDVLATGSDDVSALTAQAGEPQQGSRGRLRAFLAVLAPLGADDVLVFDVEAALPKCCFDEAGVEVAVDVAEMPSHHVGIASVEDFGRDRGVDEQASRW